MSFLKREFSSRLVSILGLKAKGFLIRICSLAISLSSSWPSTLLHPAQAHEAPQYLLLAKHSQYNLRHLDLLQLQVFAVDSESGGMGLRVWLSEGVGSG